MTVNEERKKKKQGWDGVSATLKRCPSVFRMTITLSSSDQYHARIDRKPDLGRPIGEQEKPKHPVLHKSQTCITNLQEQNNSYP